MQRQHFLVIAWQGTSSIYDGAPETIRPEELAVYMGRRYTACSEVIQEEPQNAPGSLTRALASSLQLPLRYGR